MSFTLIDLGSESLEFKANIWKWKTVLEIIKSFDFLDDGKIRQMSYNATGVEVSKDEARTIGEEIRKKILPKLVPNKRIFSDMTITEKPDDGTFYKDKDEEWKNYSAKHNWLEEFADFCLKSKGFQVY